MPLQAQGEFALVKERMEPAMVLSGQPVKRGTMAHEHIVYMMLVDSAATARDEKSILKYAPLLEELALRDDHQPYFAVSCLAFGFAHMLKGEYQQAEESLQQALKIYDELDASWQRGRTLRELGELASLRGDPEISRKMFTQAFKAFEKVKAKPDADLTKARLDSL